MLWFPASRDPLSAMSSMRMMQELGGILIVNERSRRDEHTSSASNRDLSGRWTGAIDIGKAVLGSIPQRLILEATVPVLSVKSIDA